MSSPFRGQGQSKQSSLPRCPFLKLSGVPGRQHNCPEHSCPPNREDIAWQPSRMLRSSPNSRCTVLESLSRCLVLGQLPGYVNNTDISLKKHPFWYISLWTPSSLGKPFPRCPVFWGQGDSKKGWGQPNQPSPCGLTYWRMPSRLRATLINFTAILVSSRLATALSF